MRTWAPEAIRRLRERKGVTQAAMAERLGVSRNYIYYLERGERTPSKTMMLLLDCVEKERGARNVKR